jgi:p-aminobenzoyl-glutamate transporter AbgT
MTTNASRLDVHLALDVPEDPHVTGRPLRWLQLEGLALLVGALLLFATTHQPWWLVPATILVPDLAMAGYLGGSKLGALAYNVGHSTVLPTALALIGVHTHRPLVLAFGLLWLAHIGMDRALTYGLKYDTGFKHTHLGDLSKH